MGREIRRVPANWQHPTYPPRHQWAGQYHPMTDADYAEAWTEWKNGLRAWFRDYRAWSDGKPGTFHTVEDIAKFGTYEAWAGSPPAPPDPHYYMPEGEWYQLFENVSEGTPLSPPLETLEALVDWLSTHPDYWGHQWSRESAEAMVRQGYAPSLVITADRRILQPHQIVTELDAQQESTGHE